MRPVHVLLLEDDAALRGILSDALGSEGYAVETVVSYRDLQARVHELDSVVVLADFWGVSSRELSDDEREEIRALASACRLVLVTGRAWAAPTDVEQIGVTAVLRKPFDLDDLLRTVERVAQRPD